MNRRVVAVVGTLTFAALAGYCQAPQALYEPQDRPTAPVRPSSEFSRPVPVERASGPVQAPIAHPSKVKPARAGAGEVEWREGWRFEKRTVCVELRGPNVQTAVGVDWLDVILAFRAAGLDWYTRPDDGCDMVPWDQKILVRAYRGNYLPAGDARKSYYAYVLPWTYDNPSCTFVPYVCIRLAKAEMWLNLDAMRPVGDTQLNAIASHELAHLGGLAHQPARNDTVMGYVNHRTLTATDRSRLTYIFQGVAS